MEDALVRYRQKGFWIAESFIEILSEYICKEFERKEITEYSKPLQKLYDSIDGNRTGEKIGMVGIPFDRLISSKEDENDLITIFQNVKTTLQAKGEKIEIEELKEIESRKTDDYFKREWFKPIYISSFVTTLDIMIKMLKGEWQSNNHAVWFKGFGVPDGAEEV
jgi:hypothetical protein